MFKKIVSSFMIFALLTVQACAFSNDGLKPAIDELKYSLTVEWDQHDQTFYNTQMNKFKQTLKKLKAEGLTDQEVQDFAYSQIKDQKLANEIRVAMETISNSKMPLDEAKDLLNTILERSYNEGASWNGRGLAGFALVGILAFTFLYIYTELDG
jgi:hypothetical protein